MWQFFCHMWQFFLSHLVVSFIFFSHLMVPLLFFSHIWWFYPHIVQFQNHMWTFFLTFSGSLIFFLTFDGFIVLLSSTNIASISIFVTFKIFLLLHWAIPTLFLTVLLSYSVVPYFFPYNWQFNHHNKHYQYHIWP